MIILGYHLVKMKKKIIITIVIIIIGIILLTLYNIFLKKDKAVNSDIVSPENEYIENNSIYSINPNEQNSKPSLEDVQNIINDIPDNQVIMKIKDQYIAKCDIEEMERVLANLSQEKRKTKDNVVNETIKQVIAIGESKKQGLTLSDEQMEIFDITAKKMYETSDKAMSEDEYVNKWMRIQINEEMEFKYKDIILSKIAEGTFVPEDEITREKLEIFNNNKNVSNLDDIYDSHINFLAKNYLIH